MTDTIPLPRETVQQALDALGQAQQFTGTAIHIDYRPAITALRAALQQAELQAQAREPTGCACRWDKDDNRVQICERHQGWLDVVHEWAERAKSAEAELQAHREAMAAKDALLFQTQNAAVDLAQQLAKKDAALKACVEALEKLFKRDQQNTCQHESTHRGGAIWEICDDCGAKWADDRGGKPKWYEPKEWRVAEVAITQAQEELK